jgi:hypothetical protein
MADYITKCGQGDSREFCVTETIDWNGEVDSKGALRCTSPSNSIVTVHCADCGAPYSSKSFARLEFN